MSYITHNSNSPPSWPNISGGYAEGAARQAPEGALRAEAEETALSALEADHERQPPARHAP
eukprot:scaffold25125_cov22-Prasinocladus_malaysianus.AAC.1